MCESKENKNIVNRWCSNCNMNNHRNKRCRKQKRESSHAKLCNDGSNHEFFFMMRNSDVSDIQEIDANAFLVDTGLRQHVTL